MKKLDGHVLAVHIQDLAEKDPNTFMMSPGAPASATARGCWKN